MYSIDDRDQVIELTDLPRSCPGAPIPLVLAEEGTLLVSYYLHDQSGPEPRWDGGSRVQEAPPIERIAIVRFEHMYAVYAGPPNDEAFEGHPLARRGLKPHGFFKVQHSSWIREMCHRNAVHKSHDPEQFQSRNHYALTFHDSIVECVAAGYSCSVIEGTTADAVAAMVHAFKE